MYQFYTLYVFTILKDQNELSFFFYENLFAYIVVTECEHLILCYDRLFLFDSRFRLLCLGLGRGLGMALQVAVLHFLAHISRQALLHAGIIAGPALGLAAVVLLGHVRRHALLHAGPMCSYLPLLLLQC